MAFPTGLTNALNGVTEIMAEHLNNLEAKVGIDSSAVATSLDYLLKNPLSANPGHTHTLEYVTNVTASAAELNLLNLSGLTIGWVLRATAAGTAAWGAILAGDLPTAIDAAKIADGSVSNAEFQYLASVTSDIQGQINAKLPTATYESAASIDPGHIHSKLWASDGSPEAVTVDAGGNVGIGQASWGTSAAKVLAIGSGTAPSTSPADAVQLWSADRNAVAGAASLHLRTEDGTSHVFGDRFGINTITPSCNLHVTKTFDTIGATGASYQLPTYQNGLFETIVNGDDDVNSSYSFGGAVYFKSDITNTANDYSKYYHIAFGNISNNANPKLGALYGNVNVVNNNANLTTAGFYYAGFNIASHLGSGTAGGLMGMSNTVVLTAPAGLTSAVTTAIGGNFAVQVSAAATGTGSGTTVTGMGATVQCIGVVAGTATATITTARGVWAKVYARYSGATITTASGVYIENGSAGLNTGAITNQYGLYIEDQTLGVTLKFNIYSAGDGINFLGGNTGIGQATFGTSATKTLAIATGTAPSTSPTDAFQIYSADQAAGNACLHTRTEGGAIIKLFQGAALTSQLTTLTHTAPTPDYAIQDLVNSGCYGFVTKDEGNTVLSVIANLQTRVSELETRLQAHGLLA
jgi:hypothetical protein